MRLIDADALKPSYIVASTTTNTPCYRYVSIEDINSAPTIDAVEVRHGRWILGGKVGWPKWTCSVCGGDGRGDYKLCPWCGAKMKGASDE